MDTMEQRRNRIVDFINTRASITFAELKEAFPDVSDMTLRTDLKVLDEEAKIVRVHGGAKAVTAVLGNDDRLSLREVRNIGEKELVVSKALSLIRPDTTIFLDSGSTTTMLARALPDQPLNRNSRSMYGQTSVEQLGRVRFDQAFLGVTGYDDRGFNCGHAEENALKRYVVTHTNESILLMDSSKVGKSSTFTFAEPSQVDVVVSDDNTPESFRDMCEEEAIRLL